RQNGVESPGSSLRGQSVGTKVARIRRSSSARVAKDLRKGDSMKRLVASVGFATALAVVCSCSSSTAGTTGSSGTTGSTPTAAAGGASSSGMGSSPSSGSSSSGGSSSMGSSAMGAAATAAGGSLAGTLGSSLGLTSDQASGAVGSVLSLAQTKLPS